MKKVFLIIILAVVSVATFAQTPTTNTTPVGMEHNVLFNADKRFTVKQNESGPKLVQSVLFDGKFVPSYTSAAPTMATPTVVEIEGLPNVHIQTGAWVGWSTRYWQAKRFKIEGYDSYSNANTWKTIADYSNQDYTGGTSFIAKLSKGSYTKLRFTFYATHAANGRLGVSELFFLHPEAVRPYEGLLSAANDNWTQSGDNLVYNKGMVGVGVNIPSAKLDVRGLERKSFRLFRDGFTDKYLSMWQGTAGAVIEPIRTNGSISSLFLGGYDSQTNVFIASRKEGNVGIGTVQIPVGYKLAVAGKMIAEEVKVQLKANWPDYVFTKDYSLPTLKEVENHIKEKGHLPNIPSAKEVEANKGIELGEMNRKLLEKVEELTLYTIQQEKQLKKQSEELNELKKLVQQLVKIKK